MAKKSVSQKNFNTNNGSKTNNLLTNTQTDDLALVNTAFLTPKKEVEVSDEEIENAIVYSNGATSIDFMMPEDEREILEKNLNMYSDAEKMNKLLNYAKRNKLISEELKTLELISKTGEFSDKMFQLLTSEENIAVLEEYIQRKFEEGDIAKAYKEVGMVTKAMLDARETMLQKLKTNKSGKTAKIAVKFTNDSGEDFQLGASIDV